MENLIESKLEKLQQDEKKLLEKMQEHFNGSKIYLECGIGDNMEELIAITAKIEVLEDLLNEIQ